MDIYRISSDLKFVNQIGVTLNVEERMKLELSLLKITETEKFDQVLFWGKNRRNCKRLLYSPCSEIPQLIRIPS